MYGVSEFLLYLLINLKQHNMEKFLNKLDKIFGINVDFNGIISPRTYFSKVLCKMAVIDGYFVVVSKNEYKLA